MVKRRHGKDHHCAGLNHLDLEHDCLAPSLVAKICLYVRGFTS